MTYRLSINVNQCSLLDMCVGEVFGGGKCRQVGSSHHWAKVPLMKLESPVGKSGFFGKARTLPNLRFLCIQLQNPDKFFGCPSLHQCFKHEMQVGFWLPFAITRMALDALLVPSWQIWMLPYRPPAVTLFQGIKCREVFPLSHLLLERLLRCFLS